MKTIKVAIIGTGMMGVTHSDALRRIPGIDIVALVDVNENAAKKYSRLLGIPKHYTDYKKMIIEAKPDIIHICTPNYLHFDIAKYALEYGIGVYSEKPLAMNSEQGRQLMQLAEEYELPNAVNFNYRNNAMVRDMHERITNEDAGGIFFIHGHYLQDWLMYPTDFSWRLDSRRNGDSRAIADIGSHWFDTAQFATGRKIKKIYAKLDTAISTRIQPAAEAATFAQSSGEGNAVQINTEDIAVIMMEFEGGIPGSLIVSQVSGGHKNDLTLNVDCANYAMKWEQENADKLKVSSRNLGNQLIYASAGTVHGDAVRFAPIPEGHAVAWKDALYNGINEFYNSIKSGSYKESNQTYATFKTGYEILRLVDACLESERTGEWIEL